MCQDAQLKWNFFVIFPKLLIFVTFFPTRDVIKLFIVDEVLQMQFVHWFTLHTGFPSIFLSEVFKTSLKNDPSVYERELPAMANCNGALRESVNELISLPTKLKKFHFELA